MTEITVGKIASEALKPVSGVIDALLGARVQRLKKWSEKQELSSRLGSGVIDVLLDDYLRRLLRRICGITTIVFPQKPLSITNIYEPLSLSEKYAPEGTPKANFNIQTLKAGHNYLIVDSAGMGKSTFAKHFILEILNSTTKIPIFLELRRIDETESLLGKIASEIDDTKKDVDEQILSLLLDEGNFVIVLDGYDELPGLFSNKIGQQITELALRSDGNSLILTSRPEVTLPELPDSKVFTIDPLERSQAESLVLRYDAIANIEVGKNLIGQFDVVSERFLETPLLVVLLYRTYGFNQSIATRVSSFYDEVFNALYKGHDLSKAGFARAKASGLDSEDFRRLLRGFSFLLTARQKDNIKSRSEGITFVNEAIRLMSVKPATPSTFFDDLLLAVPFLVKDGTEYRFIHKSICEFFAAEFLAYQPNSEQIIEGIRDGNLYQSFINSFQYLSDINPSLFRRLIVAPLAKSVLESPIRNPYISTICFLTEARLGVWDSGNVLGAEEKGLNARVFTHGELNGRKYTLAVSYSSDCRKLPPAAWKAITVADPIEDKYIHQGFDFNGLMFAPIAREWIPLDDEWVLNNAEHPSMVATLRNSLSFMEKKSIKTQGFTGGVKVLSYASCQELLEQIEKEAETRGWLETLISGENEPESPPK
jgi:hypothetical protein